MFSFVGRLRIEVSRHLARHPGRIYCSLIRVVRPRCRIVRLRLSQGTEDEGLPLDDICTRVSPTPRNSNRERSFPPIDATTNVCVGCAEQLATDGVKAFALRAQK